MSATLTATTIGTGQDKISRFALLCQGDGDTAEPIMWDGLRFRRQTPPASLPVGQGAGERPRAGISMLRGAMSPEMGQAEDVARKIKVELEMRGLHKQLLLSTSNLWSLFRPRRKASPSLTASS